MSSKKILIYDTTLRDGSQAEGVSFTVAAKMRVAKKLDQFGVDYIEGGWPGSNPRDMAFFEKAEELELSHARIAAFGSTRRANTAVEEDAQVKLLLDAATPVVTIFGKTWLLHVTDVLRTTPRGKSRYDRRYCSLSQRTGQGGRLMRSTFSTDTLIIRNMLYLP